MIEAARSVLRSHGDGDLHTVAAAVLDEHGRTHVGLNLFHFTGGPCAELVALATARASGARAPRVIVPSGEGPQVVRVDELLPHSYRWPDQQVQHLRFAASHLPAVRDGSAPTTRSSSRRTRS
jgi:cytidine deaminase